jgi:hypothetical protein
VDHLTGQGRPRLRPSSIAHFRKSHVSRPRSVVSVMETGDAEHDPHDGRLVGAEQLGPGVLAHNSAASPTSAGRRDDGASTRFTPPCARIVVTPPAGSTDAADVCANRQIRDGRSSR